MIRKILAAVLAGLLLVSLTGCGTTKPRYEAQFLTLFDTMTTIVAYCDSREEFTAQSQFLHDRLLEYHQLYDIYHDYEGINNIKTINDQAGIAPVTVDQRIIDLLLMAKDMHRQSEGKINVAMGSVLSLWHEFRERGVDDPENAELPPIGRLLLAATHIDMDRMIIDTDASTVFLEDPDMSLDVGSIGKGYAVEEVCRLARENGFTSALVSVGGNVRAIGSKDGKKAKWNVGIQNPDKDSTEELAQTVYLLDQSLVTSGDYQRYYTVNGKIYHHIIDPETLMPADYMRAVSIICEDSGRADALSTAVFNMPYEKGLAFIESMSGVEAIWTLKDGTVHQSSGFEALLKR